MVQIYVYPTRTESSEGRDTTDEFWRSRRSENTRVASSARSPKSIAQHAEAEEFVQMNSSSMNVFYRKSP